MLFDQGFRGESRTIAEAQKPVKVTRQLRKNRISLQHFLTMQYVFYISAKDFTPNSLTDTF